MDTVANTKARLLLVEDDPDDALLLQALLDKSSSKTMTFDFVHVETLAEALKKVTDGEFDLVILDLSLPDGHGLESFERISEARPNLPVVIYSGLNDESVAVNAIAKGAQDYVIKGEIDRKTMERIVRYAMERARLQNVREEFVGMVVHELRSPLAVSIEAVSQIEEGILGDVTDEQKTFLDIVLKSMKRVNLLIDDLLDMTKIEMGKVSLKKEKVNLVELARSNMSTFKPAIEKKGLRLEGDFSSASIMAEVDPGKISQVFINLLSNALKFTDSGKIRVFIKDLGDSVEGGVEDSGIGIDPEESDRLFGKFQQLSQGEGPREKGTGLGLAITKGLITAHRGKISAKGTKGKGTCFTFTLPKKV